VPFATGDVLHIVRCARRRTDRQIALEFNDDVRALLRQLVLDLARQIEHHPAKSWVVADAHCHLRHVSGMCRSDWQPRQHCGKQRHPQRRETRPRHSKLASNLSISD
jgi:hypothetical protein